MLFAALNKSACGANRAWIAIVVYYCVSATAVLSRSAHGQELAPAERTWLINSTKQSCERQRAWEVAKGSHSKILRLLRPLDLKWDDQTGASANPCSSGAAAENGARVCSMPATIGFKLIALRLRPARLAAQMLLLAQSGHANDADKCSTIRS